MKKWIGALCSALAGVLSLVFLAIPALSIEMFGEKENVSGWELLTKSEVTDWDFTAVTWYRIFAWILVVLAVALIVLAVLQVLANLSIIKMPAIITTITKGALIAIFVVSILTLIANFGIRGEIIDQFKDFGDAVVKEAKEVYTMGASLWVVTIINLIAGVFGTIFAKSED